MPDSTKSDEQALETILKNSGLPVHREPEWRKKIPYSNFETDFLVLNKNILVSRPSRHATLPDIEQSTELNLKVRHQGIPQNTPYIQIGNYQQLQGATLGARKYFINYLKNRKHLLAVIFCSTSPLFNFSIKLGHRIYSFDFNIQLADDLPEAIRLAHKILSNKELLPARKPLLPPVIQPPTESSRLRHWGRGRA